MNMKEYSDLESYSSVIKNKETAFSCKSYLLARFSSSGISQKTSNEDSHTQIDAKKPSTMPSTFQGTSFNARNEKIINISDPTNSKHAANKAYVDLHVSTHTSTNYLPLSGGKISGDIDMNGNQIIFADPVIFKMQGITISF